ncbi:MAG: ABC transporter permease [Bacteroidota bacterium]|nr:ABC transporter permease [Bacteroidota bacterium]
MNRIGIGKLSGFALIIALLLIWELLSRYSFIDSVFFPPLSTVIYALMTEINSQNIWIDISSTLARCFSGYIIAITIGIPVGILMGRSQRIYNLFEPLVEILRPIPSAAIIPVAILFLGIEDKMKIFVIVFACIWPILINTIDGVKSIDRILIETGNTFRLNRNQFLLRIVLPASSPNIVTGMRISLAISLILAITVEMISGNNGIGFFILDAERSFKFPQMYSGIIMIGMIGYIINWGFVKLTNRVMKWHRGFTATLV